MPQANIVYNEFENYTLKITAISPRGQRVNWRQGMEKYSTVKSLI